MDVCISVDKRLRDSSVIKVKLIWFAVSKIKMVFFKTIVVKFYVSNSLVSSNRHTRLNYVLLTSKIAC